jgi:hypothetical protein
MLADQFTIERGIALPTEALSDALSGHVSALKEWLEAGSHSGNLGMRGGLRLELSPSRAILDMRLRQARGGGIRGSGAALMLLEVRRVKRLRPRPVDVVMERGIYAVDPIALADGSDLARDRALRDLLARLEKAHQPLRGHGELRRLLGAAESDRRVLIERILDLGCEIRTKRAHLDDVAGTLNLSAPSYIV